MTVPFSINCLIAKPKGEEGQFAQFCDDADIDSDADALGNKKENSVFSRVDGGNGKKVRSRFPAAAGIEPSNSQWPATSIRSYFQKIGLFARLKSADEIVIAKKMESGEYEILRALLQSPVAIISILDLGRRIKTGKQADGKILMHIADCT